MKTNEMKKSTKKQSNGVLGAIGQSSLGLLNLLMYFTGSIGGDADASDMPPFVVFLIVILVLVVVGFICYVGAILLGEAWHKYL